MRQTNPAARAIQHAINQSLGRIAQNGGGMPAAAKKKKKRYDVDAGALVRIASPMNHAHGQVALVTEVLDKKRVIARAIAPGDDDYMGMEFILNTSKPGGTTAGGTARHYYRPYIKGVLHAGVPAKPKNKKPKPPPVLVETQEQLIEHLTSPSTIPVLIKIATTPEPTETEAVL